jgi:hypothetical protein
MSALPPSHTSFASELNGCTRVTGNPEGMCDLIRSVSADSGSVLSKWRSRRSAALRGADLFCRRLAVRNRLCIDNASDELLYDVLGCPRGRPRSATLVCSMRLQRSNGTRVARPFPKAHSVSDLGNSSFILCTLSCCSAYRQSVLPSCRESRPHYIGWTFSGRRLALAPRFYGGLLCRPR